jgi:branched-chain amino acid transport system ATP-binding protein
VSVDGTDLLAMPDFKRARWGVRRTFQTEQAIESLTVYDNVLIVHEHTSTGARASAKASVDTALEVAGLTSKARSAVGSLPANERRMVEIARAVVGSPKVILLDEPAAGLPEEETEHLASVIKAIPDVSGATVIVVEHDMSLVQACCSTLAVLDFGRLIANGPTAEVLRDPRVLAAYLGGDELL